MSVVSTIACCLALHVLAILVLLYVLNRKSTGIPLTFLCNLFLLHFGAFVFLIPGYDRNVSAYLASQVATPSTIALGYQATALGVICFVVGVLITEHLFKTLTAKADSWGHLPVMQVSNALIAIGFLAMVVGKLAGSIAGTQAILSGLKHCATVGLILGILNAYQTKRLNAMVLYCLGLSLIPLYYLLLFGFVSYGMTFAILVACSIATQSEAGRAKMPHILVGTILGTYVFLSAFVVYMENRVELRQVLWSRASIGQRVHAVASVVKEADLFRFDNDSHLTTVDARLNQSMFTGKAIEKLQRRGEYANGETIAFALVAWVPRILWPGKPRAGGTAKLAEYTDMKFSRTVSMQTGQIFEFFINFGWIGVAAGMFLYGVFMRAVDLKAVNSFQANNIIGFVRYYLVGLLLSWPGDMFFNMFSGIAAAYVLSFGLGAFCSWSIFRARSYQSVA